MKLQLRVKSINHAAILIALLVTLVVIVSGSVVIAVYHFFWWGLAVICAATMVVTYFFSLMVIKRGYLIETATAKIADRMERLEEMERYRREYLGDFAHEIKTPVFNVQGYISTLLDGALEDPGVNRMYLERADKSIERINNIVTFLDEVSHLSSGQPRLERSRFDVVMLAHEIAEGFEMMAHEKEITVSVEGKIPLDGWVVADRKYISQVMVNLVSNSIRYGSQGGWTRIWFVERAKKITVSVADNGEGIDGEDIPRIFERFFRADSSRSREKGGSGLGLAIVKHILEAHGEKILVESELGVGTTFSFTLSRN